MAEERARATADMAPGSHHLELPSRKGEKRVREGPADRGQHKKRKQRRKVFKRKTTKQHPPKCWLPKLGLTINDKTSLQGTGMLNSRILDAATILLTLQFQDARGLPRIRTVGEIGTTVTPTTQPTLQFHIDRQHSHAFVTACDGRTVVVADSALSQDFEEVALNQIEASYKDLVDNPLVNMEYVLADQQTTTEYDCVLHSIANAYELLAVDGDTECVYDRAHMRPHLLQCLENGTITEFPKEYKLEPTDQAAAKPFRW